MDCTHCEPVLLDLCYGELSPVQEREVRAHVADCPNCRKALSRLEAGQALARHLADEAPSPEMTERILSAARAHVRRSASPLERLQAWIEAMARLAMTRQFAMATLSLLIVVVGLWSVPQLTGRREAPHGDEVVLQTSSEEAAPSSEVAASQQPVATASPVPAESQPAAEGSLQGQAERPADARKKTEAVASRRSSRARGESATRDKELLQPMASKPGRFAVPPPELAENKAKGAPAKSADAPKLDARPEALESEADRLALREPGAAARSAGAALDDAIGAAAPAKPVATAAPAKPAQATAAPAAPPPAAAPAGPVGLDEMFQAGVERYRAEDYAGAAQQFARMLESSAPSGQRAAALLYLARSERALGRCDRAIRSYETLVRSYGSAQQSAAALTEAVECYDQLGDGAGALRLLEHATSVPSLAAQAQKTLHERGAAAKPQKP